MALFKKNPNEVEFPGGKKHFMEVIKNEGPTDILIWKVPYEDFNTHSKCIVNEYEEALFVKGGNVEGILEGGNTYDLTTENYPFLSRIRNTLTGGVSAFNCKIYYVNKSCAKNIKWGTSGTIKLRDINLGVDGGVNREITGYGSMRAFVDDSKQFFMKFVGMDSQVDMDSVERELRSEINESVQVCVSMNLKRIMKETGEVLFDILSERLKELSQAIEESLCEEYTKFGIRIDKFSIASMDIEGGSTKEASEQVQQGQTEAQKAYLSHGQRTYGMEQTYGVMGTAAANPGSAGGAMGAGLGLGMGLGMGQSMYQMSSNMAQNTQQPVAPPVPQPQQGGAVCPNCGTVNTPGAKFCSGCGNKLGPAFCPNCGSAVTPGSKFCSSCGGQIQ